MTAGLYRVQATIGMDAPDLADNIMNTWHFRGDPAQSTAGDVTDISAAVVAFYQEIDSAIMSIENDETLRLKVYALNDSPPRIPQADATYALVNTGGAGTPAEVALCLSYQATPQSGIPQARRRGRVFIGPISAGGVALINGSRHVAATYTAALATAGANLRNAANATNTPWVVYSPTTAAFDGDIAASYLVANGWVDNAWDTMRSRGPKATVRQTF